MTTTSATNPVVVSDDIESKIESNATKTFKDFKVSGQSKFVTVNGITLHYVEYDTADDAKKPVLLCLHGATCQAHHFDGFAEDERVEEFQIS